MNDTPIPFETLLDEAISKPGIIAQCYSMFHDYSFMNSLLAMHQMKIRGIEVGPIATFKRWQTMGRVVRKGSKGLTLCMPLFARKGEKNDDPRMIGFTFRSLWFALSQTEVVSGEVDSFKHETHTVDWEGDRCLDKMGIERVSYDMVNGNCQGYAKGRKVAVSPIAMHPAKTLIHEIAHIVLGHTGENDWNPEHPTMERSLREIEAETVAYIVGEVLGLAGGDESRGYIQHWNSLHGGQRIPEKSAKAIMVAVDKILKAGKPVPVEAVQEVEV